MYCSPAHHKFSKKGTCFSTEQIHLIANELREKAQIDVPANSEKRIEKSVREYFKDKCHNEFCWLNHLSYETRRRLEHAFRPPKPSSWLTNRRKWLNTDDIKYVMVQYQALHKDFKFFGVHPIDFSSYYSGTDVCIGKELCDFDLSKLEGKKRFAFVLNLDKHHQPGSHWVAVYCNINPRLNNFGIYYYDSVAYGPGKEVREFMDLVESLVKARRIGSRSKKVFEKKHNHIQRQFKNTECGVFCLVFLTQCVKNIPFDELCRRMKTDDDINKIRDILYRPRENARPMTV